MAVVVWGLYLGMRSSKEQSDTQGPETSSQTQIPVKINLIQDVENLAGLPDAEEAKDIKETKPEIERVVRAHENETMIDRRGLEIEIAITKTVKSEKKKKPKDKKNPFNIKIY